MKLGQKIQKARKKRGLTQVELGNAVGLVQAAISSLENDELKSGPDMDTLIKISKALEDPTILSFHCDACPVRAEIFIRKFPMLNNINPDPTVIVMKVKQELSEGVDALGPMIEKMLVKDFAASPEYQQVMEEALIQVVGSSRALEILKEQFMVQQILKPEKLRAIIQKQQELCELHGHHVPATGTEG